MPWLNRLLAAIGIGGARVGIELETVEHPRGSVVRGAVVVEGGDVPQDVGFLTLRMVEYQDRGESERAKELDAWVLSSGFTIAPHKERRYPFALALSDSARLTTQTGLLRGEGGIRLHAEAHISWAVDPRRTQALQVVVAREVTAVLQAMVSLGFDPTREFLPRLFSPGAGTTIQAFAATGSAARLLEGATLELRVDGDYLVGRMEIDPRGQSLADHLRALTGLDRPSFELPIPRAELLTADGEPNMAGALPYLQSVLERIPDPQAPENILLRPADAPADSTLLLRPADGRADTPAEQLLRPVDDN